MNTLKTIRSGLAGLSDHALTAARHIYDNVYENVAGIFTEKMSGSRLSGHKRPKTENELLIENINEARSELERAELAFNELTDNAAIDYAAYSIMAARAKYVHLLNIAKENNVKY